MKQILIGISAVATLLGARALAADLEVTAPPSVQYSNWSGPYVGVSVGTRYNAVDGIVTSATAGTPPIAVVLPPVIPGLTSWRPGAHQFIDNVGLRPGIYGGWDFLVGPE